MSTSIVLQALLNSTTQQNETVMNKKDNSEFVYIIVVILFYALGPMCLLISRVRPRSDLVGLNDLRAAENLINRMKEQIETKKILEQLRDKEYRARAWSIYRKDSAGRDARGSQFFVKNEQSIIKNLEKKIETIRQREDTSFELRHIGVHNTRNSQYDIDQMRSRVQEWSKKLVDRKSRGDAAESGYYFTIAGSSFQTAEQEHKSIMDVFRQRKLSDDFQPSKVASEKTLKMSSPKPRFSVCVVDDNISISNNNTPKANNNKVTFSSNITNFYK